MKKIVSLLLLLALSLALLAGCATGQKNAEKNASQPLSVGLMMDVEAVPFIIAQEKGYFLEEGLEVKLEFFKSAIDRDGALQSGKLDGVVSDILAAAFAKAGGFDLRITSMTNGSYKLVAGKLEAAATVKELQGKDVAISRNTVIDYVTDEVLTAGSLAAQDVNKVVIPQIPARLEMLQNGKIAAAAMPDPLATVAVQNGGRILASSDQLGIHPGVLLFTAKAVNNKEAEIQAMYRAYSKAVNFLAQEPVENYIDLIIVKAGFPKSVKGAMVLPSYGKPTSPPAGDIDKVVNWLRARQLIPAVYSYQDLVDTRFVGQEK